jgi:rhodanese-related sulfurtransferase
MLGKIIMTQTSIFASAQQRAQEQNLPFHGIVTPAEAVQLLEKKDNVVLVDVRTQAERDWVGRVQINDAQHFSVQWSLYPSGTPNPDFMAQLSAVVPNKDSVILFLCRSGVRSRHAAKLATEHGYPSCYDILNGFEGDKDAQGHRKNINGWCHAGMPWLGA